MKLPAVVAAAIMLGAPAMAGAAPPDVAPVNRSIAVMQQCAAIAKQLGALNAPPDHARAKMLWSSKITIDPAQMQFMQRMNDGVRSLEACGSQFQTAVRKSDAQIETLATATLSPQDAAGLNPVMAKYQQARVELDAAVQSLSRDRDVQAYVHKTLGTYFFK